MPLWLVIVFFGVLASIGAAALMSVGCVSLRKHYAPDDGTVRWKIEELRAGNGVWSLTIILGVFLTTVAICCVADINRMIWWW